MNVCVGARILALVACVAACGSRATPVATSGPIGNAAAAHVIIAVIAPTTGAAAQVGSATRAGVALAVDELDDDVNRTLPVDSIAILEIDAGDGEVETTRTIAHTLRGRTDIVAAIVALPAPSVTALATALDDAATPMITTLAPSTRAIDAEVVTGAIDEAAAAGRVLGEIVRARKPAVLTAMAGGLAPDVNAFERSVERFGPAPIKQSFPFAANGGVDPLGELAAANVDGLYLAGEPDQLARAIREAVVHRLSVAFVLRPSWDTPATRDTVSRAGARAYLLVPYAVDDERPRAKQFVDAYRQRTGAVPDRAAALAYDAAAVAIAAIAAADNPIDPASVGAAMHGIGDVGGASGPIAIDRQGRVRRAFVVRELSNGTDTITGYAEP